MLRYFIEKTKKKKRPPEKVSRSTENLNSIQKRRQRDESYYSRTKSPSQQNYSWKRSRTVFKLDLQTNIQTIFNDPPPQCLSRSPSRLLIPNIFSPCETVLLLFIKTFFKYHFLTQSQPFCLNITKTRHRVNLLPDFTQVLVVRFFVG